MFNTFLSLVPETPEDFITELLWLITPLPLSASEPLMVEEVYWAVVPVA